MFGGLDKNLAGGRTFSDSLSTIRNVRQCDSDTFNSATGSLQTTSEDSKMFPGSRQGEGGQESRRLPKHCYRGLTFSACKPFGPFVTSNSTAWPSCRLLNPPACMAEK